MWPGLGASATRPTEVVDPTDELPVRDKSLGGQNIWIMALTWAHPG
jgi:hypothetical protein